MTREDVINFIKQVHIAYLATVGENNTPRVRPVSINTVYDNDIYFFTFNNTRKVDEINSNPQVEAVWSNLQNLSQVRIRGKAVLVEDEAIIKRFKADVPKAVEMLPPGMEYLFCLYKICPEKVEVAEGLVPYKEAEW